MDCVSEMICLKFIRTIFLTIQKIFVSAVIVSVIIVSKTQIVIQPKSISASRVGEIRRTIHKPSKSGILYAGSSCVAVFWISRNDINHQICLVCPSCRRNIVIINSDNGFRFYPLKLQIGRFSPVDKDKNFPAADTAHIIRNRV